MYIIKVISFEKSSELLYFFSTINFKIIIALLLHFFINNLSYMLFNLFEDCLKMIYKYNSDRQFSLKISPIIFSTIVVKVVHHNLNTPLLR